MSDHGFFVLKGVVAFAGIMLYSFHLWQIRNKKMDGDQVSRFVALFFGGGAVFLASLDQIEQDVAYERRHLAALVFVVALLISSVWSICAEHRRVHNKGLHEA